MKYDLREYISKIEKLGECKIVENADWDVEIGSIAEVMGKIPDSPMLLFDPIKDYPRGYRVLTNVFSKVNRVALAFGCPETWGKRELVNYQRQKLKEGFRPVPPVKVDNSEVKENVLTGMEVDLFKFPVPKWHALDGGRFIGTGDTVIMKDPDEGWVNLGVYRVQIYDKSTATIWIGPGQHGMRIQQKYWDRGKACPVVVTCGQDPLLFLIGSVPIPWGVSEYDYVGWLRGKPVEVTHGATTDLPIPAGAEIALEGEVVPPEVEARDEGPFGEWTGYYASSVRKTPVFKVKAILHRNNPILLGCPPVMNDAAQAGGAIRKVAQLWNELDEVVAGVTGVWVLEAARGLNIPVVSVKQMCPGHAKQVALAASASRTAGYYGRFIIVVDDDIDVFNSSDVLWAMASRCDMANAIEVLENCRSTPLDPTIPPWKRVMEDYTSSRALIIACKPKTWIKRFPLEFKLKPEAEEKIVNKWESLFGKNRL